MPALLHPRRFSHRALCLVLAVLTLASPAPLLAQEDDLIAAPAALDASYALSDACVVIALRPAQVFGAPAAAMVPTEVIQAAVMQETGLDPLAAQQVLLTVSPPTGGPPMFSLHGKFSAPVTLKTDNLPLPVSEEQLNGNRYLHAASDPSGPSFYFPDDSNLVAANELALAALTSAERAAPGPLLAKFIAADRGDDLLAMIDIEALRPLIGMGMTQLPVQLVEYANLPNLVKTVELRVNLSHAAVSELVVVANNDADADALVHAFESAKQLMAGQMASQAQQSLASDDPVEQAGGRYMQRMIGHWDTQLQLGREGERLILFRIDSAQAGAGNQIAQMAVIGVLVGLLLPAVQAARQAARRNSSMNNLKQIMLGLLNHESARRTFPAHATYSPDGKPLLSWRVQLLPFMEQQALYQKFHLDEPWDSEHNKALIPLMPEVYLDPGSSHKAADGLTNYLGVAGKDCVFDGTDKGRGMRDMTDGTSNTVAVVQVNDDRAVEWTRPADWEMDAATPLAGFGGLNPGVFLAAFCDGHVTSLSVEIDPATLKALSTIAGGEVANGGF